MPVDPSETYVLGMDVGMLSGPESGGAGRGGPGDPPGARLPRVDPGHGVRHPYDRGDVDGQGPALGAGVRAALGRGRTAVPAAVGGFAECPEPHDYSGRGANTVMRNPRAIQRRTAL